MKHETIKSLKPAEICASQHANGIMEVEHSALPILRQASQGSDGSTTHPNNSGDGKRTPETWVGKESAAMKDEHSPDKAPKLTQELGMALTDAHERAIEIDTAKYQKYLDDPALTEDQKEEIVRALWTVITGFMDLGFGVQPMQEVCGKAIETVDQDGSTDSNDPKPTSKTLQDAFNAASDDT